MKNLDLSLAEQMQITDHEIAQRKTLLDFTQTDVDLLTKHKPFITNQIDNIVSTFYQKQTSIPEISLLIGDAETLRLLTNAMRRYVLELFDGHYGMDYVNRRLRIGKVHKRIGVSPKLYLSAIWLLQQTLETEIDKHVATTIDPDCGPQLKSTLNKLMVLDTQFVFDTYISSLVSEVALAKEELSDYAVSLEETVAERTRQLEELSRTDELTKLYNQRAFYEALRREIAAAERHKDTLTLIYIDLNNFKQINDNSGHLAGDEPLAMFGEILISCARETDLPCRYGGDEFAIIMPRTNLEESRILCDRIIKSVEKNPDNHGVSLSIGIASTGPDTFDNIDDLIKHADTLMYQSKDQSHLTPGSYITS